MFSCVATNFFILKITTIQTDHSSQKFPQFSTHYHYNNRAWLQIEKNRIYLPLRVYKNENNKTGGGEGRGTYARGITLWTPTLAKDQRRRLRAHAPPSFFFFQRWAAREVNSVSLAPAKDRRACVKKGIEKITRGSFLHLRGFFLRATVKVVASWGCFFDWKRNGNCMYG